MVTLIAWNISARQIRGTLTRTQTGLSVAVVALVYAASEKKAQT
jgi:hypothetical protein